MVHVAAVTRANDSAIKNGRGASFQGLPDFPVLRFLQERRQWVAWDYRGTRKVPVDAKDGSNARVNDPGTWSDYATAADRAISAGLAGVGFMLSDDCGIVGIDLDSCRDPETGALDAWAADVVALKETYTEASPSGRGLRMLALAQSDVVGLIAHDAGVEVYAGRGRYLTITGDHVLEAPVEIAAAPRTLAMLKERVETVVRQTPENDGAPPTKRWTGKETPLSRVNSAALQNLDAWVQTLLPAARRSGKGYRVTSEALGRSLEEDLSITPQGIKDFGVHDLGDARKGKRTPIDLVLEYAAEVEIEVSTRADAAVWLCDQLGIEPNSVGLRSPASAFDEVVAVSSQGADDVEKSLHGNARDENSTRLGSSRFKTVADFCAEYQPLSYIVEPIVRTGSIYTLTAKTGGGKTGLAVIIALAVATGRGDILGMDVAHGRVAYCAFENPDDVRMRIMVAAHRLDLDLSEIADNFVVRDARAKPEELIVELGEISSAGAFSLVIVDTFAAAFDGCDVNDPVQGGEFVRRLRPLTQMLGKPAVVVAAHPTKNASDEQLVPYGAGAILNGVDGNLTLAKKAGTTTTALHWQGKFRGLEFAPLHFRFEIVASPVVIDIKGRHVQLPVMRPSSADEADRRAEAAAHRDVAVLRAIVADPKATIRGIERATSISRSAVTRQLDQLAGKKLIERNLLGLWELTKKGIEKMSKINTVGDA